MEVTNKGLKQAINRSELAYELYKANPVFYNANKIYRANKLVYKELESELLKAEDNKKGLIVTYLFHLDDWMCQFHHHKSNNQPNLNDKFVFERIEGMIPFNQEFKNI